MPLAAITARRDESQGLVTLAPRLRAKKLTPYMLPFSMVPPYGSFVHDSVTAGTTSEWEFSTTLGRVGSLPAHLRSTIGCPGIMSTALKSSPMSSAYSLKSDTASGYPASGVGWSVRMRRYAWKRETALSSTLLESEAIVARCRASCGTEDRDQILGSYDRCTCSGVAEFHFWCARGAVHH